MFADFFKFFKRLFVLDFNEEIGKKDIDKFIDLLIKKTENREIKWNADKFRIPCGRCQNSYREFQTRLDKKLVSIRYYRYANSVDIIKPFEYSVVNGDLTKKIFDLLNIALSNLRRDEYLWNPGK